MKHAIIHRSFVWVGVSRHLAVFRQTPGTWYNSRQLWQTQAFHTGNTAFSQASETTHTCRCKRNPSGPAQVGAETCGPGCSCRASRWRTAPDVCPGRRCRGCQMAAGLSPTTCCEPVHQNGDCLCHEPDTTKKHFSSFTFTEISLQTLNCRLFSILKVKYILHSSLNSLLRTDFLWNTYLLTSTAAAMCRYTTLWNINVRKQKQHETCIMINNASQHSVW